jgi:molybdopterin/thiamine biosynthesis adenylyltransferase
MIENRKIYIVGVGGIGSFLLNLIDKNEFLFPLETEIVLIDGDKLEKKNLSRQLFSKFGVGKYKSDLLVNQYKNRYILSIPKYIDDSFPFDDNSIVFCCADNHGTRNNLLTACDNQNFSLIIGGNEDIDAESYIYFKEWKETLKDPRIYYKDLLVFDPQNPVLENRCQSSYSVNQTALANSLASNYMVFLFNLYFHERIKREIEISDLPYKINNTYGKMFTTKETQK